MLNKTRLRFNKIEKRVKVTGSKSGESSQAVKVGNPSSRPKFKSLTVGFLVAVLTFGFIPASGASNTSTVVQVSLKGFSSSSSKLRSNHVTQIEIVGSQNQNAVRANCEGYVKRAAPKSERRIALARARAACTALSSRIDKLTVTSTIKESPKRSQLNSVALTVITPFGADTFKRDKQTLPVSAGETVVQWGQTVQVHPEAFVMFHDPNIDNVTRGSYRFFYRYTESSRVIPQNARSVIVGNLFLVYENGVRQKIDGCEPRTQCWTSFGIPTAQDIMAGDATFRKSVDSIAHPQRISHILLEPIPTLRSQGFGTLRWNIPDEKEIFVTEAEDSISQPDGSRVCKLTMNQRETSLTLSGYSPALIGGNITSEYSTWESRGANVVRAKHGSLKSGQTTFPLGSTGNLQMGTMKLLVSGDLFCTLQIRPDVVVW